QGDDERRQAIRSEGHYRVAVLWQRLGRRGEAMAEDERARGILIRGGGKAAPHGPVQYVPATTPNNLGILLSGLDRSDDARREYKRALAIVKILTDQFPLDPEYQRTLLRSHNNLGILLVKQGKHREAGTEYERAREVQENLARRPEAAPEDRSGLARLYFG